MRETENENLKTFVEQPHHIHSESDSKNKWCEKG